jgi:hypothetical protein|nr:MAG TPA: hypothetical protein [Caudoviricetes sp.]
MKKDKVQIKKSLIPYTFSILLADELFQLTVHYNEKHDIFTITLGKNGETICEAEPIIYGVPLFCDTYRAGKYPVLTIVPFDESGQQNRVTYDNFNETVFLIVDNMGGDGLG